MEKKTFVVEVKRNSLDDGPGVRTVVFFKGCPLGCVWCQNPETKSAAQEIAWTSDDCIGCGTCVDVCDANAVAFAGGYPINRSRCTLCGVCVEQCRGRALKFAGREYSINELVKLIIKDEVFYRNTGGGLTLSGGEPTLHSEYLEQLLPPLKTRDIHVCLETCGLYARDNFEQRILPYVDLVYFDLKLFDSAAHRFYCRAGNEIILANFAALTRQKTVELVPRIPLVPGITATVDNLKKLRDYLVSLGLSHVELLPYNPLWQSKLTTLGLKSEYERSTWMDQEEKETVREIFKLFDFEEF